MNEINLYHGDCMEALREMPNNRYKLAIVDPPYRNQEDNQPTKDMRHNGQISKFGGKPTPEYFEELCRVSENQIIWGANNFQLPPFFGFVVWKKKTISENFTMSMCEIASLSKDLGTTSKWIEIAPQGTKEDPRIHLCQKPIKLYKWLLDNYAKEGDSIVDTHFGGLSIGIACHDMGFGLDAWEIDKDTFEAGKKRLENHQLQQQFNFDIK